MKILFEDIVDYKMLMDRENVTNQLSSSKEYATKKSKFPYLGASQKNRMAKYLYNLSHSCLVEHCWVELQEDISDSEISQFDIRFGFSTILLVLVGVPLLNLAIVHHEWYGEDPQKRSLPNRFLSNAILCDMIASLSIHTFAALLR